VGFEKVKEKLILQVQRQCEYGDDMVRGLRQGKEVNLLEKDLPIKMESESTGERLKAAENESFKLLYEKEMEVFTERRDALRRNKSKVYGIIYDQYCSSTMRERVKELPEFRDEIRDDPYRLLSEIMKLMHQPVRATFPYISLIDVLARWINLRQKEEESLVDYLERLREMKAMAVSHLGKSFLEEFVKKTDEYIGTDEYTKKQELKADAVDTFTTAIFLRNCDRSRYGSLIDDLSKTYALGVDQYPRTLQGAMDVLRKVKFDRKEKKKKESGSGNGNEGRRETSFAQQQSERRCFACGDRTHILPQCPNKGNIPRAEWFDRTGRERSHHQTEEQPSQQGEENSLQVFIHR